jgi:hypothetical protein
LNPYFTVSLDWDEGAGVDKTNGVFKSAKTHPLAIAKITLAPSVGYYFDATAFSAAGDDFSGIDPASNTTDNFLSKGLVNGEPGSLIIALTYEVLEKDLAVTDITKASNYVGRIPRPIHGNSVVAGGATPVPFGAAADAPFTAAIEWEGEAKRLEKFIASDYAATIANITITPKEGYQFPQSTPTNWGSSAVAISNAVAVEAAGLRTLGTAVSGELDNIAKYELKLHVVYGDGSAVPYIYNRITSLNAIPVAVYDPIAIKPVTGDPPPSSSEITTIDNTWLNGLTSFTFGTPAKVRVVLTPAAAVANTPGYTFKGNEGSDPYFTAEDIIDYFDVVYANYINPGDIPAADLLKFDPDQFQIDATGQLIFELTYYVKESQIIQNDIRLGAASLGALVKPAASTIIPSAFTGGGNVKFNEVDGITWTDKAGAVVANGTNAFDAANLPYTAVITVNPKTGFIFDDTFDILAFKAFHSATGTGSFKETGANTVSAGLEAVEVDSDGKLKITLKWTAF